MGIAKNIGITIGILFGIILAVGVVVASTPNVTDRASDIVVRSDELKEVAVESSNVADKVEECTREVPKVENRPYDKFVSNDCLIEKAETVADCKAYTDIVLVEYDTITSLGNVKHVKEYFTQVEECVTKVALQNHDVSACNSLDYNTSCVIAYAKEFRDPKSCMRADDAQSCFNSTSLSLGFFVCNVITNEDMRVECGKNYLAFGTYSDEYSSSKIQERCFFLHRDFSVDKLACQLDELRLEGITKKDLLSWKTQEGLAACMRSDSPILSLDKEKWNDYCMASIGVYLRDLSTCDQAGVARVECYAFVAVTEDSVGLDTCDRLDNGVSFCYMHVAYRLNDITICEKPKVADNKENCIRLVKSKMQ